MNTKQMQAALSKIKSPKAVAPDQPLAERVAVTIGAVPSNVRGFLDTVSTSYRYHEAVRKGQL